MQAVAKQAPPSVWREMLPRLVALAGLTMAAAVVEAAVIVAMVPLGLAIASGESTIALRGVEVAVWAIIVAGLVGLALRFALLSFQAWFAARLISGFEAQLRRRMVRVFLQAEWGFKSQHSASFLQNLVTVNVARAVGMVGKVVAILVALGNLAVLLGAAVLVNPAYAAGVALVGVAMLLALRPLTTRTKQHSRDTIKSNVAFTGTLAQAVALGREIQVYRTSERISGHLNKGIEQVRRLRMRINLYTKMVAVLYSSAAFFMVYAGLAVVWFAGLSDLAALGTIVLLLLRSSTFGQQLQSALHGIGEMAPYVQQVEREHEQLRAAALPSGTREIVRFESISLRDVWFAYANANDGSGEPVTALAEDAFADKLGQKEYPNAVLRGAELRIARGEIVALVGASGVGKSTLVHLLLGLRQSQRGVVSINDAVPLMELKPEIAARLCAYVPQDPVLLNVSVAQNIRFFRNDIDDTAVEHAARLAHIHEDIAALPESYATLCGERGDRFSGGQRQRICIARALVGQPGMLVFDEPTSALDPKSDAAVHATLAQLKCTAEVAILVVSHRATSLGIADRIITLQDGKVIEGGVPAA